VVELVSRVRASHHDWENIQQDLVLSLHQFLMLEEQY
jgi:hypothetical protein